MADSQPALEQERPSTRPLYLMIAEETHNFLDEERKRRKQPGRAPVPKSAIVREALDVYQTLVKLSEVSSSEELAAQLQGLMSGLHEPISSHTRIRKGG